MEAEAERQKAAKKAIASAKRKATLAAKKKQRQVSNQQVKR